MITKQATLPIDAARTAWARIAKGKPDAAGMELFREAQKQIEGINEIASLRAQNAELLAALSAALQSMDARNDDAGLDMVRQIARAAIAKATGAQS